MIENMTLAQILERARELAGRATPPPWEPHGVCFYGGDGLIGEVGFGMRDDDEMVACVELLCHLVNNLPELTRRLTVEGEAGELADWLWNQSELALDAQDPCPATYLKQASSLLLTQAARVEELEKELSNHPRCIEEAFDTLSAELAELRGRLPKDKHGNIVLPGSVVKCPLGHEIQTANAQHVYRCQHPDCYDDTMGDKGPHRYSLDQCTHAEKPVTETAGVSGAKVATFDDYHDDPDEDVWWNIGTLRVDGQPYNAFLVYRRGDMRKTIVDAAMSKWPLANITAKDTVRIELEEQPHMAGEGGGESTPGYDYPDSQNIGDK